MYQASAGEGEPYAHDMRQIGGEDHIHDTGISAPVLERHGRGRRHIEEEDHQVTRLDQERGMGEQQAPRGRKLFPRRDELQDGLFGPAEAGSTNAALTPQQVKPLLRELLTQAHGMVIFDEHKWNEATVEKHGTYWKFATMTEQRRVIGREGANPRALAEKLSMTPVAEMRHFGVRFGGREVQPEPVRKSRGLPLEENPTLVSPGVQAALVGGAAVGGGPGARGPGYTDLSCSRREPEEMSRRYIASGKDHWASCEVASHGSLGDARDMGFCQGLERGVGHGKRHIAARDNLAGGVAAWQVQN